MSVYKGFSREDSDWLRTVKFHRLGTQTEWKGRQVAQCPYPLSLCYLVAHEVSSTSPSQSRHHDVLFKCIGPRDRGLNILKLWAKICPFSFKSFLPTLEAQPRESSALCALLVHASCSGAVVDRTKVLPLHSVITDTKKAAENILAWALSLCSGCDTWYMFSCV